MIQTIFSRTDIFLLFVIFIIFLSYLILTMCKCVKKAIVTFALATIFLILFIEEYYNKHKSSHWKISIGHFQKLLTNNHKIILHRHHPKKAQQYPQLPKTPKHPHEFLFKIIHTLLKNDTLAYPNH